MAPDLIGGAHSAAPDPLGALRGPTSKGEGDEEKGKRKGERRRGEGGKERSW